MLTAQRKGRTPLLAAASSRYLEATKLLLKARANMEAADNLGEGPRCGAGWFEFGLLSQSVMDRSNPNACWVMVFGNMDPEFTS